MSEDKKDDFDISGMLDSKREASEVIGFYEEVHSGFIRKQVMSTYKKEFVKLYYLNSLTWSPEEKKFILGWKRRMSSMELSDKEYEEEFEMFKNK
jgi:hypothetical protein